jgi:hypothetical protein
MSGQGVDSADELKRRQENDKDSMFIALSTSVPYTLYTCFVSADSNSNDADFSGKGHI